MVGRQHLHDPGLEVEDMLDLQQRNDTGIRGYGIQRQRRFEMLLVISNPDRRTALDNALESRGHKCQVTWQDRYILERKSLVSGHRRITLDHFYRVACFWVVMGHVQRNRDTRRHRHASRAARHSARYVDRYRDAGIGWGCI